MCGCYMFLCLVFAYLVCLCSCYIVLCTSLYIIYLHACVCGLWCASLPHSNHFFLSQGRGGQSGFKGPLGPKGTVVGQTIAPSSLNG